MAEINHDVAEILVSIRLNNHRNLSLVKTTSQNENMTEQHPGLTLPTENKVDQFVREWQEFNQATSLNADELFDLCLNSETTILTAFEELTPRQLLSFTSRLKTLGADIGDPAYHHQRACDFAERLSHDACKFDLGPAERQIAEFNLHSPGCDLASTDINNDIARELLGPRALVYRQHLLELLTKDANARLAAQVKSLVEASSSPSPSFSEIIESEGLSDPLPYDDISHSTSQLVIPKTAIATNRMAISTEVQLPLPILPQGWTAEKEFKPIGTVSKATQRSIEPVGPHFLAHARRARHKRTFSEDDRIQAQESVKKVEDEDAGEISEPEDPSMLLRDAKDWKGQDHYAVLGLSKYRWKATEEQIKRAHRKKVLRHHPDKKAAAGNTEDDSFFKCIQKATEILLDPVKRRQFDSVDEAADVEPPTKKQTQKGNFYKLWGPVFKSEGRFSRIQPVPKLGDEKSSKEDVENFYNFWYNFDSWRSFEYQDEDVPDDNENRDQKRHMERKNNNARKKKKTEDSARLRKLLDDCSSLDERIKKFRQEANASKNKKKLEKEAAEKKAAEEAKTKKEADEKAAKEAEEAAKVEREQGKKAKEAAKNALKKNKRVLKGSVKDANYFVSGDPPAATIDAVLNDVELVQSKVDPDEIATLAAKLTGLKIGKEIQVVWSDEVKRLVGSGKLKDGEVKTLVL